MPEPLEPSPRGGSTSAGVAVTDETAAGVAAGGSSPPVKAAAGPRLSMARATGLALFSSVLGVGAAIVRSKVTAVILGPEGIGQSAEINQIFALVAVPIGIVSGVVLITLMAREIGKGDSAGIQRVYDACFSIALVLSALGAMVAFVMSRYMLPASWGPSSLPLVLTAGATLVAVVPLNIATQSLVAFGKLKMMTGLTVTQALVGLVLACGGVVLWGLKGQFLAALISPLIMTPIFLQRVRRTLPELRLIPRVRFSPDVLRAAAALGATTMLAGWAQQGSLTTIRWALERQGGLIWNGQFQAANAIAGQYFNVLAASMSTVVFPRYAAARSMVELEKEAREAYRFVLRVAPAVFIAIAFRQVVIRALYSHRFDGAIAVLGVQMVADSVKAGCWVQGGLQLGRAKLRALLTSELTTSAVTSLASLVLIPRLGLVGAGYALMTGAVYNLLLCTWLNGRIFGFRRDYAAVGQNLGYAAVAFAVLLLTSRWPWTQWLVAIVVGFWAWRTGLAASILDKIAGRLGRLRRA